MISDIITKANDTTECSTLEAIYQIKSLAFSDLNDVFAAAEARQSVLDHWAVVDEELVSLGRAFSSRIRLKSAVIQYLHDRSTRAGRSAALVESVRSFCSANEAVLKSMGGIAEMANFIAAGISASLCFTHVGDDVFAASLAEAFEVFNE